MTARRPDLVFLSGPPFGPLLFRGVTERLGRGTRESVVDPERPERTWRDFAAEMAARCAARDVVVVAHGLAVPGAVAAALVNPPAALVLCNGPLHRLDPFAQGLASAAAGRGGRALLSATLLRPAVWTRWLRSSAGLRRAVVNPYVMDRDTVATLCGPLVATSAGRRALASWLGGLSVLPDARSLRTPTLLLWGDSDPLYPASEASFLEAATPLAVHRAIPGGQHLHPEERPWELADRLATWLSEEGLAA